MSIDPANRVRIREAAHRLGLAKIVFADRLSALHAELVQPADESLRNEIGDAAQAVGVNLDDPSSRWHADLETMTLRRMT